MQIIPSSENFEKAVLVGVLQNPALLPGIQQIIGTNDFFFEQNKQIFKTIESVELANLDSLTVLDRLDGDTRAYLENLIEDADNYLPTASNVMYYAEEIKAKSNLRAGIDIGNKIVQLCYNENDSEEALVQIEDILSKFVQSKVHNKRENTQESFKEFLAELQTRIPNDPRYVRTGYKDIDLMIQRLEGLTVLAARTSVGKTSIALNILLRVLRSGKKIVFFSLEQSQEQLFERLIAMEYKIPHEEIREGVVKPDQEQVSRLIHLLENVYIDDTGGVNSSYIASAARQKSIEMGEIGLIIIDYLHIVKRKGENIVTELGEICSDFRNIGKELGCPVLLLSQLSRPPQEGKAKRPQLTDLRHSGEIEQVADSVIFLHRESYQDLIATQEDIMEVIVAKNRNGRTGMVELRWLPSYLRLEELNI